MPPIERDDLRDKRCRMPDMRRRPCVQHAGPMRMQRELLPERMLRLQRSVSYTDQHDVRKRGNGLRIMCRWPVLQWIVMHLQHELVPVGLLQWKHVCANGR